MDEFLKAALGWLFWLLQFGEEGERTGVEDITGRISFFGTNRLRRKF